MSYRVWVRSWIVREEVFDDRDSAERFRLKLAASCPTLPPADVVVAPERPLAGGTRSPDPAPA